MTADTQQVARVAAADWLQVLDSPEVTEAQLQSWLEWCSASAQNRDAFSDMQRLYRRLAHLSAAERQRLRWRLPGRRSFLEGPPLRWGLAACALLIGALCLVPSFQSFMAGASLSTYVASADRHRTVQLADGSRVVLAPDAMLTVRYSRNVRAVQLERGRAYFEVHHDRHRPFLVRSGSVQVIAVGTAFNVSRDDSGVAVTVTDGTVDVDPVPATADLNNWYRPIAVDHPTRLSKGHRLVIDSAADQRGTTFAADARSPEWHHGQMAWKGGRLSDVIEAINRDAATPIRLGDPRVADLRYSGTILRGHVDEWVAALSSIYPVQVTKLDDGSIVLTLAPGAQDND